MTDRREGRLAAGLVEAIRQQYLAAATGVLEVVHRDGRHRLYFRAGELYLDRQDPLSAAAGLPQAARVAASDGLAAVARLFEVLLELQEPRVEVVASEAPQEALVGPLPTGVLLMEHATRGRGEGEMLADLGGEAARLAARTDGAALQRAHFLEPTDAFLLSRLERPEKVGKVLRESGMGRRDALARLVRLWAVGLAVPAAVEPELELAAGSTSEVAKRFAERIGRELGVTPLTLPRTVHRAKVAELFGRFAGMTHYELLGVSPSASIEEVHRAYEELARRVHPSHAVALQLAGGQAALALLFERATEAYLVLMDPRRRGLYNLEMGITAGAGSPSSEERGEERKRLARQNYAMATELAAAGDYHFAIELLRQSLRADPRAEYYALMARCQAINPRWLHQAVVHAREAVRLKPEEAAHRLLLAQILERAEDFEDAAHEFLAALDRAPNLEDAHAGLERAAVREGRNRDSLVKRLRAARHS